MSTLPMGIMVFHFRSFLTNVQPNQTIEIFTATLQLGFSLDDVSKSLVSCTCNIQFSFNIPHRFGSSGSGCTSDSSAIVSAENFMGSIDENVPHNNNKIV